MCDKLNVVGFSEKFRMMNFTTVIIVSPLLLLVANIGLLISGIDGNTVHNYYVVIVILISSL